LNIPLPRRLLTEFLGAAFLAAVVIGAGIAAQRLSPIDTGLELFEVAAATAGGLFAVILMFGPASGGHFNPAVSLADATFGGIRWRDALAYIPAQIGGCITGAIVANGMFAPAAISIPRRAPVGRMWTQIWKQLPSRTSPSPYLQGMRAPFESSEPGTSGYSSARPISSSTGGFAGTSASRANAGGGTRTPDTRIMIPDVPTRRPETSAMRGFRWRACADMPH
jgi:hypothetical protein